MKSKGLFSTPATRPIPMAAGAVAFLAFVAWIMFGPMHVRLDLWPALGIAAFALLFTITGLAIARRYERRLNRELALPKEGPFQYLIDDSRRHPDRDAWMHEGIDDYLPPEHRRFS